MRLHPIALSQPCSPLPAGLTIQEHELAGCAQQRPDIYDRWLSLISEHIYTYRLARRLPEAAPFCAYSKSRSLDGFTVVSDAITLDMCRLHRDSADIARDGRDSYSLHLSLRGVVEISQMGRTCLVPPGALAFMTATEPAHYSNGTGGENELLSLIMPSEFVDQRIVDGRQLCARALAYSPGSAGLSIEALAAFKNNAWHLSDAQFRKWFHIVADLALSALSGGADRVPDNRSVRAVNLGRARRIIRQRLAEPDLTLEDIARACGFSLSYLHGLFRDEDYTLAEFLKRERLMRARELLELSPSHTGTVTEIALQCGFSNMSHFSTSFKRTFGMSPSAALCRKF